MRAFCQYCSDEFTQYFYDFTFPKNANTKNEYISYVNLLCNFLEKDFLDITVSDAQRFLDFMNNKRSDGKLDRKTISVRLASYNTIASYISDRSDDYSNPFSRLIRPTVKSDFDPSMIPSLEELDMLFSEAKKEPQDFLILALATRCALSASSILQLDTKSIVFDGDEIQLHMKSGGDFDRDSFILLPEDVRDILKDFLEKKFVDTSVKAPLFKNKWGNALSIQNVDQLIKRLATRCGLEKYTLKDFRNSAIYDMVESGASVDDIMSYTGLKTQRLEMFFKNKSLVKSRDKKACPPELVNIRIIN